MFLVVCALRFQGSDGRGLNHHRGWGQKKWGFIPHSQKNYFFGFNFETPQTGCPRRSLHELGWLGRARGGGSYRLFSQSDSQTAPDQENTQKNAGRIPENLVPDRGRLGLCARAHGPCVSAGVESFMDHTLCACTPPLFHPPNTQLK